MEDRLTRLINHRRALHEIPETCYDLPETQEYVLRALKTTRAEVSAVSPSGVLAYFDMGACSTVAFRSDMDALPVQETSGVPFVSRHAGKTHACGHDAHMAMQLALAEEISRTPTRRNVLIILQPAEESGNGAELMIGTGALDKYGVSEIYACHVEPSLKSGVIASRPGEFMARASEVHVTVRGKSSHIAEPQNGVDALMAGLRFVRETDICVRERYANVRHLYGYGSFSSGRANNVISNETHIAGTLRAYDDAVFESIRQDVLRIAEGIGRDTGARFEVEINKGYPPLINSPECYERIKAAAQGLEFEYLPEPHLIAEDFACYLRYRPGLMFNLGINTNTPLHDPAFRFDESALVQGTQMFLNLANID
ncbi:MAG: amidohydrolase [Clostridia bacterium]|nr:amidohydrolase [Clostridia bacterium]